MVQPPWKEAAQQPGHATGTEPECSCRGQQGCHRSGLSRVVKDKARGFPSTKTLIPEVIQLLEEGADLLLINTAPSQ